MLNNKIKIVKVFDNNYIFFVHISCLKFNIYLFFQKIRGTRQSMITTQSETQQSESSTAQQMEEITTMNPLMNLTLPSNATSIRENITDGFSCEGKMYGYYADIENDCQIFHVCLPVVYSDGMEKNFRWSFICPEETVFSQEYFTCVREEDLNFDCSESEYFYDLNQNFGAVQNETAAEPSDSASPTTEAEIETTTTYATTTTQRPESVTQAVTTRRTPSKRTRPTKKSYHEMSERLVELTHQLIENPEIAPVNEIRNLEDHVIATAIQTETPIFDEQTLPLYRVHEIINEPISEINVPLRIDLLEPTDEQQSPLTEVLPISQPQTDESLTDSVSNNDEKLVEPIVEAINRLVLSEEPIKVENVESETEMSMNLRRRRRKDERKRKFLFRGDIKH